MTARRDLREDGRVILAHGEATGHHHEVVAELGVEAPQYFEEPGGRRVLLAVGPCVLTHPEHGPIHLEPDRQEQARQGDVLLMPIGGGAWEVVRQVEYTPQAIRAVID